MAPLTTLDGARERAAAARRECDRDGHVWGDAYSFGGVSWHRDCVRCFDTEALSADSTQDLEMTPERASLRAV